jgi:hypothetical protein
MAAINQSPSGQTSVTLSGISLNGITATASPYWESTKIVQGGSFAVSLGSVTTNITTEAILAGLVTVTDALGNTAMIANANNPPAVVSLEDDALVAVADTDSPSLTIFGAALTP